MTHSLSHSNIKLRVALLCTDLSYAALLVVLTIWATFRAPGFSLFLWVLVCTPLLILWPAMRRRRHRGYAWLCFVILPYFVKAVEGSLSSVASWIDFSVLSLSVVIFISAMLTSRYLQHNNITQDSISATDKEA